MGADLTIGGVDADGVLRGDGVSYHPDLGAWLVSRYDTVRAVLCDPAAFSASAALEPVEPLCDEARAVLATGDVWMPPLLANNDPPDHTIQRRFLGGPFRRGLMTEQRPMIVEVVEETIAGLAGRTSFDLARDVAWPIPVLVLVRFLGIPIPDVATLKRWAASRVELMGGHPTPEVQVELAATLVEFMDHARQVVLAKQRLIDEGRHPGDDYTSALLLALPEEDRDPVLVRRQICANLFNLLAAGHETTTHVMANTTRRLLTDRDRWRALADDPSLAPAVVDEAIRMETSVRAWRRRTTTDVELEGVTIPAGSLVVLALADANRDPERFAGPEAFEPGRANAADHLSFGFGIHRCLGAHLARLELTEYLARFPAAFPHLTLVDDGPPRWIPNLLLRAADRLPVRVDRPGAAPETGHDTVNG